MVATGATLSEMQQRSTEVLEAAVVDEIINQDPVLPRIPFTTLNGTQFRYLRESTIATPQFYTLDEELVEGTPTTTEVTVDLKQIGLNADTHGFADTLENVMDQRAFKIRQTAKAMMEEVGSKVVYGNSSSSSREFDGLHALMPSAQVVNEGSGTSGSALNLSNLDQAIHNVRNGMIVHMTMTRNIMRRMSQYVNFSDSNTPIRYDRNQFGVMQRFYGDIPMQLSDRQTQTEALSGGSFSAETGGATSSIFLLQYGMPDSGSPGLFGIAGAEGMNILEIGWLEGKDVWRDRVRWYLGLGLGSTKSVALVDGITDATVAS